jgi:MFS family permease
VIGLQLRPQVLLLPWTGLAADRFARRSFLCVTQAALGVLALVLGALTVAGVVQLWHVYVLAFLLGCVTAFDAPTRLSFVSELVADHDLPSALGLGSTSFHAARLVGPAIVGVLIPAVGTGWVFVLNAASFLAVLVSLRLLRVAELRPRHAARGSRGDLMLHQLVREFPEVCEGARGEGFMWGLVLQPGLVAHKILPSLQDAGVLVTMARDRVLRISPPLVVTMAELEDGVRILGSVLAGVRRSSAN